MVKHLHMVLLKKNKWILIFGILLMSFDQTKPKIDIEQVRSDFIATEGHNIPIDFIQRKNSKFQVFYIGNECFVHLRYKDYLSEPQMKSSAVAIYLLTNGKWTLEKILPYYYDINIADGSKLIFLSQNLFCEPTGACSSYLEVSAYKDGDFISLANYNGHSKTLYYNYALGQNDISTVSAAVGDTIANEYVISNLKVESKNRVAFNLTQKISVLKSVTDTLNVSRSVKSVFVRMDL